MIGHALPRRSIDRPVIVRGPGLFSALQTVLTMLPAAPGTGIVFRRTDLPGEPTIPATIDSIAPPRRQGNFGRCTVLSLPGAGDAAPSIHTTEHLLSATSALGITDLLCEMHGAEVPMLDGSAAGFVAALLPRVVTVGGGVQPLIIRHPITLHDQAGSSAIHAEPSDDAALHILYALDYGDASPIRPQSFEFSLRWTDEKSGSLFQQQIAPARTFCSQAEADQFRAAGFFAHVAPEDVLVIGPGGPVGSSLRFEDEPARHKLLDVIGDLALVGRPIIGRLHCTRSGHVLNAEMAQRLASAAAT